MTRRHMEILVYIVTTMLALESWAINASESTAELKLSSNNSSLNTLGQSFCSLENVSRMTYDSRDLLSRITLDMERIGWDLARTISDKR